MILDTFIQLFDPVTFLVIFLATILGIIIGALPGVSGGVGVALMLPLTFGMDPQIGLAMLVSIWIGGVSGGMIASILLGIPGEPASIATTFDGYPMARNGQAGKAIGAAIIASFLGTSISICISMFLSPVIARIALSFGPWEYFSLGFCAISLVAVLSRGSVFHGMTAAALGLLLSTVGFSPIDGYPRFSFGNVHLSGGIDLVPMLLGFFALTQIVQVYSEGEQKMPDVSLKGIKGFGVTMAEFLANGWNLIRSFTIGLWIGFLPGMGPGLSNLLAYAQAKASSKNPEEFGKGKIDGVFAPEIASNAAVGGCLIPMVALGIPGDGVTAMLLGGLMIHGIQPGPLLFTNNPAIVYTLFLTALIAAGLVVILQYFGMRLFPAILKVPGHYLYPTIVVLAFFGVFVSSSTSFMFIIMLLATVLSLTMERLRLPIAPFILAFILGPILELNLRRGITYTDEGVVPFFTRPISGLLLAVAAFSIIWPYLAPVVKARLAQRRAG